MISLVAFVCKYPQQEFLILEQWKLKPCAESQETAPNFWLLILKPTVTGWLHRGQSVWGFWQQNIWGRIFICVFRLKYRKLDSYLQKVVFELIPFSNCGVRTHLEISRIPELRQSEFPYSVPAVERCKFIFVFKHKSRKLLPAMLFCPSKAQFQSKYHFQVWKTK